MAFTGNVFVPTEEYDMLRPERIIEPGDLELGGLYWAMVRARNYYRVEVAAQAVVKVEEVVRECGEVALTLSFLDNHYQHMVTAVGVPLVDGCMADGFSKVMAFPSSSKNNIFKIDEVYLMGDDDGVWECWLDNWRHEPASMAR